MEKLKTSKAMKYLSPALILSLFFYLSLVDISYSRSNSPESYLAEGIKLYERGEYALSLQQLSLAETYFMSVAENSEIEQLAEIYFYQGLDLARQGNKEQAKAIFKQALSISTRAVGDVSIMNKETKEIFRQARIEYERELNPEARGKAAEEGKSNKRTSPLITIAAIVVLLAAIGTVGVFFVKGFKGGKGEEGVWDLSGEWEGQLAYGDEFFELSFKVESSQVVDFTVYITANPAENRPDMVFTQEEPASIAEDHTFELKAAAKITTEEGMITERLLINGRFKSAKKAEGDWSLEGSDENGTWNASKKQ